MPGTGANLGLFLYLFRLWLVYFTKHSGKCRCLTVACSSEV